MVKTGADAGCWYAVHTRSNFEARVAADLRGKGIEQFVPCNEEMHQWKDRKKKLEVPLFPGYVFTRFQDCPEARISVLRTNGVVRILGNGGAIEPIPENEIAAVHTILAARVGCYPHAYLREGSPVRVIRGALTGLEGLLVKMKNQARLVVSVNLLSRSVAAEVDSRDIEPIRTPGPPCTRI
jgi:transcription antitermination factor NusG